MKRLLQGIADFFDFSPAERRGFVVLSILIILLVTTSIVLKFLPSDENYHSKSDLEKLDSLVAVWNEASEPTQVNKSSTKSEVRSRPQEKKPYKTTTTYPDSKYNFERQEFKPFEVNSADTTTWKTIRGIGSSFASRIVKYRSSLGGFYSLNQLNEVYGLEEFAFDKSLTVDTSLIQQFNINSISYEELLHHPYFNSKQSGQTISYRTKVKPFESNEDLLKIYSIDSSDYLRIKPYLEELPIE